MRYISLRTQVLLVVGILAIAAVGSVEYFSQRTQRAREMIVNLDRDHLASITEDLAKRFGSIISFVSTPQLGEPGNQLPPQLVDALKKITRERLHSNASMQAGIYTTSDDSFFLLSDSLTAKVESYRPMLRLIVYAAVGSASAEWSHHEAGKNNFLLSAYPVFARGKLIGVAWAYDGLNSELSGTAPFEFNMLLNAAVICGVVLALFIIIMLRREVNRMQKGLEAMKSDGAVRLSTNNTELGAIAASINTLADTINAQQREREQLQRQIQQRERLAALGQLVAGVAHQIRTPIAAIKTRVQLWQRAALKSKRKISSNSITHDSMDLVVRELNRAETIVRQLLYFSKQRKLQRQQSNLHEILALAVEPLRDRCKRQRIKLKKEFDARNPAIAVDRRELHEVVTNLLMNSIEAMPRGGTLVVATSDDSNRYLTFSVSDSGHGVSPENAANIFNPFFTTKDSGTGLGLSIAYEIVAAHGGKIEYQTNRSRGATFIVSLPRNGLPEGEKETV